MAVEVKQMSENHRFGLDVRVGGGVQEGLFGVAVHGLGSRVSFLLVGA